MNNIDRFNELKTRYTTLESFKRVMPNSVWANLPVYESGYDAMVAGLNPMSYFWRKSTNLGYSILIVDDYNNNCGYREDTDINFELCRLVEEPGEYRTRGEFGNTIFCYTVMDYFYDEDGQHLKEITPIDILKGLNPDSTGMLKTWDSDYGWL